MKKTIFGMAALAALVIAGCSKDDDNADPRVSSILGKWKPAYTKVYVYDKTDLSTKISYTPVYDGDYMDFRNDGKVYIYESNPNEGPGYDPHDTLTYKFGNPYLVIGEDTLSPVITKDSLTLTLREATSTQDWETTYKFNR